MSLFEKKKLYKLIWSWGNPYFETYTEIVSARDPAHAWRKVKRKHAISINLVSLEEIK